KHLSFAVVSEYYLDRRAGEMSVGQVGRRAAGAPPDQTEASLSGLAKPIHRRDPGRYVGSYGCRLKSQTVSSEGHALRWSTIELTCVTQSQDARADTPSSSLTRAGRVDSRRTPPRRS